MLRERVMEWTREWKQEGIEQGLLEGRREGRLEGEQRVFLRLLERRFGTPDADLRARIEKADDDQLLTWSENLLSADRLEDVFH
jgi:flagellar biosynthesis/type III secretory pathway protein FliH